MNLNLDLYDEIIIVVIFVGLVLIYVETYLNSSGLSRFHLKKMYIPLSIREQLKLHELKKWKKLWQLIIPYF